VAPFATVTVPLCKAFCVCETKVSPVKFANWRVVPLPFETKPFRLIDALCTEFDRFTRITTMESLAGVMLV